MCCFEGSLLDVSGALSTYSSQAMRSSPFHIELDQDGGGGGGGGVVPSPPSQTQRGLILV